MPWHGWSRNTLWFPVNPLFFVKAFVGPFKRSIYTSYHKDTPHVQQIFFVLKKDQIFCLSFCFLFAFTLWSTIIAKSTKRQVLFLLITSWSDLLARIRGSVRISLIIIIIIINHINDNNKVNSNNTIKTFDRNSWNHFAVSKIFVVRIVS